MSDTCSIAFSVLFINFRKNKAHLTFEEKYIKNKTKQKTAGVGRRRGERGHGREMEEKEEEKGEREKNRVSTSDLWINLV